MAAKQPPTKSVGLLQFPGLANFLVVLVIAFIEVVGLVLWLRLEMGESVEAVFGSIADTLRLAQVQSTVGMTRFPGVVLGVFFLVEHVITQVNQTGRLSGKAFIEILAFSIIEVVIWIIWLAFISMNGILALVFFIAALFVEHQIADNVKKGLGFLHFVSPSSRVFLGLIIFTIAEVIAAGVWVGTGSVIVLALGSIIEHYIARNVGQIRE